jgi:hypothetical protein
MEEKVLTPKDLVSLFKFAIKTMGISGYEISKIIVKHLIYNKGQDLK